MRVVRNRSSIPTAMEVLSRLADNPSAPEKLVLAKICTVRDSACLPHLPCAFVARVYSWQIEPARGNDPGVPAPLHFTCNFTEAARLILRSLSIPDLNLEHSNNSKHFAGLAEDFFLDSSVGLHYPLLVKRPPRRTATDVRPFDFRTAAPSHATVTRHAEDLMANQSRSMSTHHNQA